MNARDGMSSIILSFTAMLIGVRDDAFISHYWSARNLSSIATGIYAEVLPLYVHVTADVLTQKLPMCLNLKSSTTYYSTIHPGTSPANSISFIINLSFGFV